jgi:hypothetical protein
MPRRIYVDGDRWMADDAQLVMDQSVMTFPTVAARDAAIPNPADGMVAFVAGEGALFCYRYGFWRAIASPWSNASYITGQNPFPIETGVWTNVNGLGADLPPSPEGTVWLLNVAASLKPTFSAVDCFFGIRVSPSPFIRVVYQPLVGGAWMNVSFSTLWVTDAEWAGKVVPIRFAVNPLVGSGSLDAYINTDPAAVNNYTSALEAVRL